MKTLATIFQTCFELKPTRNDESGIDEFIPAESLPRYPRLPGGRLQLLDGIGLTDSTVVMHTLHRGDYWETSIRGKPVESLRTDCPAILFTLLGPAGTLREHLHILTAADVGLSVRFKVLKGEWKTYRDDLNSEYWGERVFRASRAEISSIELTRNVVDGCQLRMVG